MAKVLDTIKKMLGIESTCTEFDTDILVYINSASFKLFSLGIPKSVTSPVVATSQTEWSSFIGTSADLESIKEFVYLYTKLIFDPPTNSTALESMNNIFKELEWRLHINEDSKE